MRGILIFSNEDYFSNYEIMSARLPYDYSVSVKFDALKSFKEVLVPNKVFLDNVESFKKACINVFDDEFLAEFLEDYKGRERDLLENVEFVYFSNIDYSEVLNYLEANKELQAKKIVLNVDYEKIEFIKENFNKYLSNIYFSVLGNDEYTSFADYISAVNIIDNYAKEIKSFNFSPLETIMYVYDIVRSRVYKFEDSDESYVVSRDLISALLGDKIVCMGYANIFKAILDKLEIKSNISLLSGVNSSNGHARNVVRVIDSKYNIDGIYYFDTTYDSKRRENDFRYLYGYRYFAKTKSEMDLIDRDRLMEERLERFSDSIDEELIDVVKKQGQRGITSDMIRTINQMSRLTNGPILIDARVMMDIPLYPLNLDETVEELRKVIDLFDVSPLSADILCEVLYNVRKNQFYNYDQYPFGIDPLYNVVKNSKWAFEPTAEEKLFKALGLDFEIPLKEKMIKYIKNNDLDKKVEEVKLAKVLKKTYEKKLSEKDL